MDGNGTSWENCDESKWKTHPYGEITQAKSFLDMGLSLYLVEESEITMGQEFGHSKALNAMVKQLKFF